MAEGDILVDADGNIVVREDPSGQALNEGVYYGEVDFHCCVWQAYDCATDLAVLYAMFVHDTVVDPSLVYVVLPTLTTTFHTCIYWVQQPDPEGCSPIPTPEDLLEVADCDYCDELCYALYEVVLTCTGPSGTWGPITFIGSSCTNTFGGAVDEWRFDGYPESGEYCTYSYVATGIRCVRSRAVNGDECPNDSDVFITPALPNNALVAATCDPCPFSPTGR